VGENPDGRRGNGIPSSGSEAYVAPARTGRSTLCGIVLPVNSPVSPIPIDSVSTLMAPIGSGCQQFLLDKFNIVYRYFAQV